VFVMSNYPLKHEGSSLNQRFTKKYELGTLSCVVIQEKVINHIHDVGIWMLIPSLHQII
jgi:hypothetical protein